MYWVIGIVVLVILYAVVTYNGLVSRRERVRNAWAQVDVQLKRRYDLIPNLVNTAKAYAKHERETFEEITRARVQAIAASSPQEAGGAESKLSSTLRTLFAVAENYPELKADANFRQVQQELSDAESKIAYARQFYNDTVQKFNIRIQAFPASLLAGAFGFEREAFFDLQERTQEREAVRVDFSSRE